MEDVQSRNVLAEILNTIKIMGALMYSLSMVSVLQMREIKRITFSTNDEYGEVYTFPFTLGNGVCRFELGTTPLLTSNQFHELILG